LTHFSSRYSSDEQIAQLVAEATKAYGSDAVTGASDLAVLQVHPPKAPESDGAGADARSPKAGRPGARGGRRPSGGAAAADEEAGLSKSERRRRARRRAEAERAALVAGDGAGTRGGGKGAPLGLADRVRQLWASWTGGKGSA